MTSHAEERPSGSESRTRRRNRRSPSARTKTGSLWNRHRYLIAGLAILLCLLLYPRARALLFGRDPVAGAKAGTFASKSTRDINVLLLGVDEREGDTGRSDTMMLLNYNALWGTLHLMSVPRDTRVSLPGHSNQKINAAYTFGGPDLAKQAVGQLTGLYVDYYIKVNFDGFSEVVDALGGVDIDVKERMVYRDPYQDLVIDFQPGRQHLNGEQALEYVRWRGDARADLARVERQRDFVNAAFRKVLNPLTLFRIPSLLIALQKSAATDIPLPVRPGLASSVAFSYLKGVQTSTAPGTTGMIGDGSYFLADKEELGKIVTAWSARPTKTKGVKSADGAGTP